MEQRVDEIDAEQHGDDQADDGFGHGASPSELGAGERIEVREREHSDTGGEEDEVRHDGLLVQVTI
jgi:hypothetical protein